MKFYFYNQYKTLIEKTFLLVEGNGKLKMNDGSVMIGQYRRSSITGLRREWDADGNLTAVAYRYRDAPVAHCW
jgi:hypothetical protein